MKPDYMPSSAGRENSPDILPAPVNTLLATLWVGLFGGRWLLVPLLQAGGFLSQDQTADWDEGILTKFYLILLSITCIVLALRAVRHLQRPKTMNEMVASVPNDNGNPVSFKIPTEISGKVSSASDNSVSREEGA